MALGLIPADMLRRAFAWGVIGVGGVISTTNLAHLASRECTKQTPVMAREELDGV